MSVYKRRKRQANGELAKTVYLVTEEDPTESMEYEPSIELIKNATIDDKEKIIQLFEETRDYRIQHPKRIVDDYINAFRLVPTLVKLNHFKCNFYMITKFVCSSS